MAEIHPEYIDPGVEQGLDNFAGTARRPNGSDDFCLSVAMHVSLTLIGQRDEYRAKIIYIRQGRSGHNRIAERFEKPVAIVAGQ
jgi:hypothetical protein